MSQTIITIGSKLLDDIAIASHGKIVNQCRVTEISPLSFWSEEETFIPEQERLILYEQMQFVNEYAKKMFSLDFGRKIGEIIQSANVDHILIDVSILRLPVHRFLFQNGHSFLITENQTLINNKDVIIQFLEKYYGKLQNEECINMFKISDQQLKRNVEQFVKFFKPYVSKIICVDIRFSAMYISKRNTVEILDKQNVIYDTNILLQRLSDLVGNQFERIKVPDHMYGEEKMGTPHMLSFNSIYLNYLAEAVLDINRKDILYEKCKVQMQALLEEVTVKLLAFQINKRYKNRKVIIIGKSNSLECLLAKEYGIKVYKTILYNADMTEAQISAELCDISWRDREYYCALPVVYNDKVITALWKNGYGFGIGYCAMMHSPYRLVNFVGHYEDCFENIVDTKMPLTIELRGTGAKIVVETSGGRNNMRIIALSGIDCHIAENVEIERDYSLRMYDGAKLSIDSGTHLGESGHIRCSFNTTTHVGADVNLGKDVIIFNGDGHAIIDLHSGDNINYAYDKSKERNHVIEIEKGCVLKDNTFVLSGTHLKENTIVEADSFVNSNYEKDRRN